MESEHIAGVVIIGIMAGTLIVPVVMAIIACIVVAWIDREKKPCHTRNAAGCDG